MSVAPEFIEIPKGYLFSPDEAARRKMWAEYFIGQFRGVARAEGYGLFAGGSLVRDIDLVAVPWRNPLGHATPDLWVLSLHHSMGLIFGNHGETVYGHQWWAMWDPKHPDHQIDLKIIKPGQRYYMTEDECPGHVADGFNKKRCGRCGIHIDSLR